MQDRQTDTHYSFSVGANKYNTLSHGLGTYLNTIESVKKTIQCGKYKDAQICIVLQSLEAYSGSSLGCVTINWRTHDRVIGKEMP